ncbi:MAG TPA: hypothetical protein PKH58_01480 [Paludibacteraceae bacterium]|nr:hypothetical protein [Paludibacteraceae bacterium]
MRKGQYNAEYKPKPENTSKRKTRAGIHVTDHAIVRFLERVCNIDIENLKDQIVTDELLRNIERFGPTGAYPCNHENPYMVVIDKKQIITILPVSSKHYQDRTTKHRAHHGPG